MIPPSKCRRALALLFRAPVVLWYTRQVHLELRLAHALAQQW